jgi:hypothetical protein
MVTQDNIAQTICMKGYTATIRPPASYTTHLKLQQLADPLRGYTDQDPKDFEEDHLISLEIGGNPRDPGNLWPEHWADPDGAKTKDRLENELNRRVCLPKSDPNWISLSEAQTAISTDWIAAYQKYVGQ